MGKVCCVIAKRKTTRLSAIKLNLHFKEQFKILSFELLIKMFNIFFESILLIINLIHVYI